MGFGKRPQQCVLGGRRRPCAPRARLKASWPAGALSAHLCDAECLGYNVIQVGTRTRERLGTNATPSLFDAATALSSAGS